jgi:hypothetical protein
MRHLRTLQLSPLNVLVVSLALGSAIAGCGRSSDTTVPPPAASQPAPPATEFPSAAGKNLREIIGETNGSTSSARLILTPQAMVFYQGSNRYPLSVSQRHGGEVVDASVALYIAKVLPKRTPKGSATESEPGPLSGTARGPYPVAIHSLATPGPFQARQLDGRPPPARVVYVTNLHFPSNGEWMVTAVVRKGSKLLATTLPSVNVGEFKRFPQVGDPARRISTQSPQNAECSGAVTVAPGSPRRLNQSRLSDALGRRPALLLFTSPAYSPTQTGGPVVAAAEHLAAQYPGAAFICESLYRGDNPANGVRQQARVYRLPSELWLFAIDRSGTIVSELEGAFDRDEMQQLVRRAIRAR